MKLLLDSQAFLWLLGDTDQLGKAAKLIFRDGKNQLYVSAVSIWELGLKNQKKSDQQPISVDLMLESLPLMDVNLIELRMLHLKAYGEVDLPQKDPFDRMLVAQAASEDLIFATSDKNVLASKYDTLDITK